jgi:hypothetical protein
MNMGLNKKITKNNNEKAGNILPIPVTWRQKSGGSRFKV